MTPLEASTVLLLHFEESTGAFIDSGARHQAVSLSGAVAAASGAKFGSYCYAGSATQGANYGLVLCNGTEVSFPDPQNNPYSVELFAYLTAYPVSSDQTLFVTIAPSSGFNLSVTTGGKLTWTTHGTSTTTMTGLTALSLNTWHHIVVCRDALNMTRIFIDGVIDAGFADMGFFNGGHGTNSVSIGFNSFNNGLAFTGKLDEFRYVIYQALFNPQYTLPASENGDTVLSDPSYLSVSLSLHGNGSNNGTTFTDSSANVLTATASGSVVTSTTDKVFGTASIRFPGTSYLTYTSSALFDLMGGDFTAETWVKHSTGSNAVPNVLEIGTAANNRMSVYYTTASQRFSILSSNSGSAITVDGPLNSAPLDTWHHVALVKKGSRLMLMVNGCVHAMLTNTGFFMASANMSLTIGYSLLSGTAQNYMIGNVDDFRITKGVSRYDPTFTPPTSAYADCPRVNSGAFMPSSFSKVLYTIPTIKNIYVPVIPSLMDRFYGGKGMISGTVEEQSTPTDNFLHRRVRLSQDRDGIPIREVWSDKTTGEFSFPNIDETQKYSTTVYDYLHNYRAVIADNLTPVT